MKAYSYWISEIVATAGPALRWSARRAIARRSIHRSQRGVALVEALISILIFSFGVLGLIGLEARAINFSVDAEDRNRAALFASEMASSMWLNNSVVVNGASNPTLASWQAAVADPTKAGLPGGNVTVLAVPGTTNAADITVSWRAPSRPLTDDPSVLTTRVILP